MPTSRIIAAIACTVSLVGASCSDSADTAPTGSAGSTTEPTVTDAGVSTTTTTEAPSEEPEFIELTYFEGTERATFSSLSSGDADDECEDLEEGVRRCEGGGVMFDSVATQLGRAHDESARELLTYAAACPTTGEPGTETVLRGSLTSQWGDEMFFKFKSNCGEEPDFFIVTGGTGLFEGASGTMTNTYSDHPTYLSYGTGQLSVRADLWADVIPPAPAESPDPAVEYLDVAYFDGVLSSESTSQSDEECDQSDPDVIVCNLEGRAQLRGTLIGDATQVSTGTRTQLLTEACEFDDGTTGVPDVIDATGTITSRFGDELYVTSRTRIDPCATLGSGESAATSYWRVTGGTGRFEDAHGLMSGVTTPDLGFEAIDTGTLSVRADRWPQLAAEYATLPTGPDIIELRYWERFLGLTESENEPPEECDTTDPAVEICDYGFSGNLTGTHIGAASETQTGTITRRLDETCDGTTDGGAVRVTDGAGVMTTPWGDELPFRIANDSCEINYWWIDGGGGRFEGAGGVMTGLAPALEMGDDTVAIFVGTFHLRADLWEDLIPDPD